MNDVKACIECKHMIWTKGDAGGKMACLVMGGIDCSSMRVRKEYCGIEAKWFKPKEDSCSEQS